MFVQLANYAFFNKKKVCCLMQIAVTPIYSSSKYNLHQRKRKIKYNIFPYRQKTMLSGELLAHNVFFFYSRTGWPGGNT
jgi:hypothetical protein